MNRQDTKCPAVRSVPKLPSKPPVSLQRHFPREGLEPTLQIYSAQQRKS